MSADRFAKVERIYHEAKSRPSDERAAFLNQACGGDEALRQEVESLLSLKTDPDGFLSRPALEEAVRASHRAWEPESWPTIPGYTVKRVLGEGGMGVVYLAEQEKPFRRLVALKLIKPGMDTRQVVARFETERQALALMDHPNIAAVFDAGTTQEGRPYFVMEYVDGVSITDYCDEKRLSTRDRLALFVQVCGAVQHAHQKGVIHRDLKPTNVLVAERDSHALPKVIDFGTAKAVGGAWSATATQGGQGMVLGTLEYMSPEQAALSADIDTATDVYSLGILLYELLVGRLPFDTDELRAAGYDEMRRVIRESDPPKPSVRVEHRASQSGAVARSRRTDVPGLTRQLRGDLDWITLKALEKDRRRRYATVAAFATDVGRFLDDQPVEARPPSSTYRIRKFTRRHRLAVAAVAVNMITVLTAGVTATASLYWKAEASRREAQALRREAELAKEASAAAERAAARALELQRKATASQAAADIERRNALNAAAALDAALQESSYQAYVATLSAAAGDLRAGAAVEARTRLLRIPEAQRGWDWRLLFIQTDESVRSFSFANADPNCLLPNPILAKSLIALSLDADGQSILVRRCMTLDRWNRATLAHTEWSTSPRSMIVAENSRGRVLTLPSPQRITSPTTFQFQLVLTDRSGSAPTVALGPFAFSPICADISSDGARIALGVPSSAAVRFGGAAGDVFEVWNVASNRLEHRLTPPVALPDERGPASCKIRFSPDGRRIATSGETVHVWDVATGAERASDQMKAGADRQAIAFNRAGNLLAIGRPSGLVDVMDLRQPTATLVRLSADKPATEHPSADTDRMVFDRTTLAFVQSKGAVVAVAFARGDQTVVSATSTTVGLWDITQSRLVRVLSGHAADIVDVVVSDNGSSIYSVDTAGVIREWSPTSVPPVTRTPSWFLYPLSLFVMNANGTLIAAAESDGALTTIRPSDLHQEVIREGTGKLPGRFASIGATPLIAISPDGLRLFAAADGFVSRWTHGSKEPVVVSANSTSVVKGLTVSPSGSLLALAYGNFVAVWDATTMKELGQRNLNSPLDLLFRDEETLIISYAGDSREEPLISSWNWRTNRVNATVAPGLVASAARSARPAVLSADGRRIAFILTAYARPSSVSIWDSDLKTEIGRLPSGDYQALAFSPDGRRIVTVGFAETAVRIWDAERFLPLVTLSDIDSHTGVAFTAAGQIVASRTGGGLTIWETQIRKEQHTVLSPVAPLEPQSGGTQRRSMAPATLAPTFRLIEPTEDTVLTGSIRFKVEITGATLKQLVILVDQVRVCRWTEPPFECTWDAGPQFKERVVSAIATTTTGQTLTSAVRTKGGVESDGAVVATILVTAHPTDCKDRFVKGLSAELFRLRDEGVPQQILHVSEATRKARRKKSSTKSARRTSPPRRSFRTGPTDQPQTTPAHSLPCH